MPTTEIHPERKAMVQNQHQLSHKPKTKTRLCCSSSDQKRIDNDQNFITIQQKKRHQTYMKQNRQKGDGLVAR